MSVFKKWIFTDKNGKSTEFDVGADAKNIDTEFTQASSRANIASGEKLNVILGKIMKWFTDLTNGGASSLLGSNLTTNRALVSNSSGKVAVSTVTATELGYLSGVTSNIQSQFNSKKSPASFVVSTQMELNAALTAMQTTGGKIILREGTYELRRDEWAMANEISITFEGMGTGLTSISFIRNGFNSDANHNKSLNLIFKDLTCQCEAEHEETTKYTFISCALKNNSDGGDCGFEMFQTSGDVKIIGGSIVLNGAGIEANSCYSGFNCYNGKVSLIGCDITLNSGTTKKTNTDLNLVYGAIETHILGCNIFAKGVNRINLVNNYYFSSGDGYIGGISVTNSYLNVEEAQEFNITHYTTSTIPQGSFVGNSVRGFGGYLGFATVNGNHFKYDGGTAIIKLLASTNMQANHFWGAPTTIDCQQHKSIISNNTYVHGGSGTKSFTVTNAPTGSVTTGNITI